jgi:hypothetical protein
MGRVPAIEDVTDELYSLPPGEFVGARAAVVAASRAAGDKATAAGLATLRKPTVSAWLANSLVRTQRDLVEGALAVGPALKEATVAGDGAALRDLTRHRKQLLSELLTAARLVAQDAGVPFSAAVQRELESTLTAAATDPDAAALLLTGRLTAPLSFSGLGFELGAIPPERPAGDRTDRLGSPTTPARRSAGTVPRDDRGSARSAAATGAPAPDEQQVAVRGQAVADAELALAAARLQDADASAGLVHAEEALATATAEERSAAAVHQAAKGALSDARADVTAAKADAAGTGRAVEAALQVLEAARRDRG